MKLYQVCLTRRSPIDQVRDMWASVCLRICSVRCPMAWGYEERGRLVFSPGYVFWLPSKEDIDGECRRVDDNRESADDENLDY